MSVWSEAFSKNQSAKRSTNPVQMHTSVKSSRAKMSHPLSLVEGGKKAKENKEKTRASGERKSCNPRRAAAPRHFVHTEPERKRERNLSGREEGSFPEILQGLREQRDQ